MLINSIVFYWEELGSDGISSTVWQSNIKLNNIILGLVVFEVVENAKLVSDQSSPNDQESGKGRDLTTEDT